MKKTVLISLALGATLLLGACTEQTVSQGSENDATTPVQTNSTTSTQKDVVSTASTDDAAPEPVGDGLYRISAVPKKEPVTLACAYGTTSRYEGATAEAFGQTFDFSQIPVEYDNSDIPYCVRTDLSTVYFADYFKLYQADCNLLNPQVFCTLGNDDADAPYSMNELIAFDNTKLLFFQGDTQESACIGSIDPETGAIQAISAKRHYVSVPCNAGVMLYDYEEAQSASSTVLYWECGEIRRIPLKNPKESEVAVYVSANGKYICTYLWGKTQDEKLVERYSVYDVKSGNFLKSFDWTFQKPVGDKLPAGFSFININEETKSVYLKNTEDAQLYQFAFGEDAS